jgi:pyruvate formate lyase activating enzyme
MMDTGNTPARTLIRAAEIGYESGLQFVYAGNLPGQAGRYENTYCPASELLLIGRRGFTVHRNVLADGRCPRCRTKIPGFWNIPAARS